MFKESVEKRVSILIGISEYRQKPLPSAIEDVKLMNSLLKDFFDKIYILTNNQEVSKENKFLLVDTPNKTKKEIESIFNDNVSGSTLFWIHFSGHGRQDNDKWILEQPNGNNDEISLEKIICLAKEKKIRRLLITIDACRVNSTRSAQSIPIKSQEPLQEGIYYIGACVPGARTIDGVFTSKICDVISNWSSETKDDLTIKYFRDQLGDKMKDPPGEGGVDLVYFYELPLISKKSMNRSFDTLFIGKRDETKNLDAEFHKNLLQCTTHDVSKDSELPKGLLASRPSFLFWSTENSTIDVSFKIGNEEYNTEKFVDYIKNLKAEDILIILNSLVTQKDVEKITNKLRDKLCEKNIKFFFWKNPIRVRGKDHLFNYIELDSKSNSIRIKEEKREEIISQEYSPRSRT